LVCTDEEMALWMLRAIVVENVAVRREGRVLYLPAGPAFQIEAEIKNVVTVVAKTHHYWTEHRPSSP
jgi:sirohydrochlorin cobaltochelatase